MTQEQYERAAEIQAELKKLKKVVAHLKYDNSFVKVHVSDLAGYDDIRDKGLKNCMEDYLSCRISELEKEFKEL